jgi:hypothetical protein
MLKCIWHEISYFLKWKNSLSCSVTYFSVSCFYRLFPRYFNLFYYVNDVNMSANLWRHFGCKLKLTLHVINLLTLKTVDISSRFSPVFHHIYQWVKFEIIILDDNQWYSTKLKSLQPKWRHKLTDIFTLIYISNKTEISWEQTIKTRNWKISYTTA